MSGQIKSRAINKGGLGGDGGVRVCCERRRQVTRFESQTRSRRDWIEDRFRLGRPKRHILLRVRAKCNGNIVEFWGNSSRPSHPWSPPSLSFDHHLLNYCPPDSSLRDTLDLPGTYTSENTVSILSMSTGYHIGGMNWHDSLSENTPPSLSRTP